MLSPPPPPLGSLCLQLYVTCIVAHLTHKQPDESVTFILSAGNFHSFKAGITNTIPASNEICVLMKKREISQF